MIPGRLKADKIIFWTYKQTNGTEALLVPVRLATELKQDTCLEIKGTTMVHSRYCHAISATCHHNFYLEGQELLMKIVKR